MKKRVIILRIAVSRLTEAAIWYESQQQGLSNHFLDDFKTVIDLLSFYPESCQVRQKNFRFAKFRRFPYLIIYTYESNRVIVRSIINAKRDPAKRFQLKS